MIAKQKLKKRDRNFIIFAAIGFAILIIAGFVVIGGAIGYLVGNLNENLKNPPDAEKIWKLGEEPYSQTALIQKYYGTKIIDRKTDAEKKTDSVKLSTNQGWDFWFFCKKGSNFGNDCYYRSIDSEENRSFGGLLNEMNQDIITELANKYGGQKIRQDTYGFGDEEKKKAFAEEVAKIDTVKPTVEICKEIKRETRDYYCLSITPIKVGNDPRYTDLINDADIYSFI